MQPTGEFEPRSAEHGVPAQQVLDGFRLLYGGLALLLLVLLFVPFTGTRSLADPLMGRSGGELLLPVCQLLLVVLLVTIVFRLRSGTLPKAIALAGAGWLVIFVTTRVFAVPPFAWGAFATVAFILGTIGLATTHAVLGRRRAGR